MEYRIIDTATQEKLNEIRRRIRRLQNRGCVDSLENMGINTQNQVGASYVSLKALAANYEPDEKIAFLLWGFQKREEQLVACLLLPKKINKEKITQLMNSCISAEIAEYFGSLCLSDHAELREIAEEWSSSASPFLQIAALTGCARYRILHKTGTSITQDDFKQLIHKDYTDKYVCLVAERYK